MSRPRKRAFSRVLSHFLHLCSTFIAFPPSRLFSSARAYIYNVYARRYQSESWIIRNLPPCGDEARTTRCTAAYKKHRCLPTFTGEQRCLGKGGPGGDRTLVQTGKSYAFYMLSSLLEIVGQKSEARTSVTIAVSSINFICGTRLPPAISDMPHHANQEASGKTALG